MKKGSYSSTFNGVNLASGIYYYRLKVDDKVVAQKKMTLIK